MFQHFQLDSIGRFIIKQSTWYKKIISVFETYLKFWKSVGVTVNNSFTAYFRYIHYLLIRIGELSKTLSLVLSNFLLVSFKLLKRLKAANFHDKGVFVCGESEASYC